MIKSFPKVLTRYLTEKPLVVVDVGAAGGIQPLWHGNNLEQYCRYFGFEPNQNNFDRLKEDNVTKFFRMALSDKSGTKTFHAFSTVGSFVKRNEREALFSEVFEPIEVAVETLERLRVAGTLPRLDVIKTDCERHDYFVIKGAGGLLATEALCVTCEFEYYGNEEGSRFRDIDSLLTNSGFLLFGLQSKLGQLGELSGGDLLYLKDVGHILSSDLSGEERKEQLLKLFMICLILGQHVYAFVVASAMADHGVITTDETQELKTAVKGTVFLPMGSPLIRSGLWLANALSYVGQILSGQKWASKAAPRTQGLHPYAQLSVKSSLIPSSWRARYVNRLEIAYERYKKLRGIVYN